MFVLFAAAFSYAFTFKKAAAAYPFLVNGVGCLLCIIYFIQISIKEAHDSNPPAASKLTKKQKIDIIATIIISLAYVLLVQVVGYMVMTFLYLLLFSYYLDKSHKKITYVLVALGFDIVLYLAFELFLHVPLPTGFLI